MLQKPPLAKLTPPRLRHAHPRERLFTLLDHACADSPAVWIDAPPGAGKSVLAASYLEARKGASLWLQLDGADSDPASFFHYLALAAHHAAPDVPALPRLTAEYAQGTAAFARNFFRELYARLPTPFVWVFDEYPQLPADSPLHDLIRLGLEEVPAGGTVLILSRAEPPPALARLLAHRTLARIGWEQLRLDASETAALARTAGKDLDEATAQRLHARTEGWAAGIILLLDQPESRHCSLERQGAATLFNYFVAEILTGMATEQQDFLLKSALLPRMELSATARLTGHPDPEREFTSLMARNGFVYRLAGGQYQYHALFRESLLAALADNVDAETLARLRQQAARLLEDAGETADAAQLLILARDGAGLEALIVNQAEALLAQGRGVLLAEWITARWVMGNDASPWLGYWLGLSRLPFAPAEARSTLEEAYASFVREEDIRGRYRTWCAIVDTFIFSDSQFAPLDHWIEEGQSLSNVQSATDATDRDRFATRMFLGLMRRRPEPALIGPWRERAWQIALHGEDASLRIEIGGFLLIYEAWWLGHLDRAVTLLDSLQPLLESDRATPYTQIAWGTMASGLLAMRGENAACLDLAEHTLDRAEASGIHVWDHLLWSQALFALLSSGQIEAADGYLAKMAARLPTARGMERATYHYFMAWRYYCRGEAKTALPHAETGLALCQQAGYPFPSALFGLDCGRVMLHTGQQTAGLGLVQEAAATARTMGAELLEYRAALVEAEADLAEADEPACLGSLAHALAIGAAQNFRNHAWWHPPTLSQLYAIALERGIETEYVTAVIRQRGLDCPEQWAGLEAWPWPVKIHTLGGLALWIDGLPVDVSARVGTKPLELLIALLCHEGQSVPAERLAELLWPDADGDRALNAYHVTLKRLREWLGEGLLVQRAGQLRLDTRRCWVDCWAYLRGAPENDANGKARWLALDRGDFLPNVDAPHVIGFRQRLQAYRRLTRR